MAETPGHNTSRKKYKLLNLKHNKESWSYRSKLISLEEIDPPSKTKINMRFNGQISINKQEAGEMKEGTSYTQMVKIKVRNQVSFAFHMFPKIVQLFSQQWL